MKNPFAPLFRSVLQWVRAIPRNPSRPSTSLRAVSLSNGARLPRAESRGEQAVNMTRASQSRDNPSHDREGVVQMLPYSTTPPPLTPEQFRQMLAEALATDPETRQVIARSLIPYFPVEFGACTTDPAQIFPGTFGSDAACSDGPYGFRPTSDVRVGFDYAGTNKLLKTFTTPHSSDNVPSQLDVGIEDGGGGTVGMIVKNERDGSVNSQYLEFRTHHGGDSFGTRMTIDKDGNILLRIDYAGITKLLKKFTNPHSASNVPSQLDVGIEDGGGTVGMIVKDVQETPGPPSRNSQYLEFATHHGGVDAGTRMTIDKDGNILLRIDYAGITKLLKKFTNPQALGNVPSQLDVGIEDGGGTVGMIVKNERDGSVNSQYLEFRTHHGGVSFGTRMTIDKDGNIETPKLNQIVFLKPSGGDDTSQIQSAIYALAAANPPGGIIMLTPGTYNISSTISVSSNSIKLRGYGGTDDLANQPLTLFKVLNWTAPANSPVIRLGVPNTSTLLTDLELSDVTIDGGGNSGATIGLQLDQLKHSRFVSVRVRNMRSVADGGGFRSKGIHLTTTGGNDCAWNLFENCVVNAASQGVVLDGNADHDTDHNTFIGLTAVTYGGNAQDAALWLRSCDNNSFYRTYLSRLGAQGYGVLINGLSADPTEGAGWNYFYHLQAGGGLHVLNAATPWGRNFIYGYDKANGEPDPTTDNGSPAKNCLSWIDGPGQPTPGQPTAVASMSGFGSKRYLDLASPLSASNCPATNANEFGFVWDGTKFWLVYNDGTNKWKWQGTLV